MAISILVLIALLYPKSNLEGFSVSTTLGQYSSNYVIALNNPITPTIIYEINPKIKEGYQDPELYRYFVDKSIESNIDIIYNISFADCLIFKESGWNPDAKNPISSAHGLGQFLDNTWINVEKALKRKIDRNDSYDQIDAFTYLLSNEGYKHWTVASNCIYLLPINKRIASLK